MDCYSKYFLQCCLWLDDGFCSYYVQDTAWGRQDILDVESVIFDWEEDAEDWLHQCAGHDPEDTYQQLRNFLADDGSHYYHLQRMNDRQVLSAAARELIHQVLPVVIKPHMGWAVLVDAHAAEPVRPIAVEPAPDLDGLLSALRHELDTLVAGQQRKYDAYEARLAQMSETGKAAFYTENGAGAFAVNTIGSIRDLAKALPGFYPHYLKALWKVVSTPARMGAATARSITTGDLNPLQNEIDAFVNPIAQTWEQSVRFKSILAILLGNPDTYQMLYDFSHRYWDATHPVERTRMAVNAASDILVTILLAIFTAGIGAAANAAAKSGRLLKVAKLLERVALTLKKINPSDRLLGKTRKAAEKLGLGKKARSKAKKGIPDVEKPKTVDKLDDKPKKRYGEDKPKKYKNKPPTKEEIFLAKKPGKSAKQIIARKKVAAHFYKKQGMKESKISGHLQGIDFEKPVEIEQLSKGQRLAQYQVPKASQGNYYAPPSQEPSKLGISEYAQDWDTGRIVKKEVHLYEVNRDVDALGSTAAKIEDDWSIPGKSISTDGGGKQYFTMEKSNFDLVE